MTTSLRRIILTGCISGLAIGSAYCASPLEVACRIGDRLVSETPFRNRLVLRKSRGTFDGIRTLDFSRTYGPLKGKCAYAYTSLSVDSDTILPVQTAYTGECEIILNGQPLHQGNNQEELGLEHEERNVELPIKLALPLRKGGNDLVVRLTGSDNGWTFCLQPEPDRMNVESTPKYAAIGLKDVNGIDTDIAAVSDWLVCGPFDASSPSLSANDNPAKDKGVWDRLYSGTGGHAVAWTIPHVEVAADVIDPAPWGTPYNWNYHNGGMAWAMQRLGEITGNTRYTDYCDRFCNFHLDNLPLIAYQVDDLMMFDCTNHHIYKTPLLDFTLAPSLPYVYKLAGAEAAERDPRWADWVDGMMRYSREQLRLPGSTAYTRTSPEEYTTWVDDMFMGIPFLIHAYRYTGDKIYLDDALGQIDDFNKVVWDKDANLYMHAQYTGRDCKLPHWSRANGWGLWAVTEALTYLPENDPHRKSLLKHYKKHIDSIIKYQPESGMWFNVLEYPESREEVSGTAIFTLAIARGIRNGWLDGKKYRPVVEKAWKALQTRIDSDGSVRDICYGTMCSEDVDYYINRPFYTDDTHGLFAVLFACLELNELFTEN